MTQGAQLATGSRFGRYLVRALLGSGGMGEVYLAHDPDLERLVALKLLPLGQQQAARERLLAEARAASALNHPNILTVYETGIADGLAYIATEHIDGMTLRQRIGAGPLAVDEALAIAAQVASALGAAHRAGIVHHDIKPENVMVRKDGWVKVVDFGLAGADSAVVPAEGSGARAGTLHYMSPEQVRGLEVDSRSDWWSLGVLIHECLRGRPPFEGEGVPELAAAVVDAEPPPLAASLPEALLRLVGRCMAKARDDRPKDAGEVLALLDQAGARLPHLPAVAEPPLPAPAALDRSTAELEGPLLPDERAVLPLPADPLLGRQDEVARVQELLGRVETRLVTVTGPGGTGKTRLALEVAHALEPSFRDGAVFVALAEVADAGLVTSAIASALGAAQRPDEPVKRSLERALRDRATLLVLDNFEHVIAAAPQIAALLEVARHAKVLVTSRESLRVAGEQEFALSPMSVPADQADLAALCASPALLLFVRRAQAVLPDFTLDSENAAAVAAICRRLDGLPLAIELAAARIKLLPPARLLERLELDLLAGGGRDRTPRQRTMRGALEWGVRLLAPPERLLFGELAVFAGWFTLEAAEAIASPGTDVLGLLGSLVDKSLLRREDVLGEPRFSMLHVVREYAREAEAVGREARLRHAGYHLRRAEEARSHLAGKAQRIGLERLAREHADLRAALAWADSEGDDATLGRLAAALWWFWYVHGYYAEARVWLDRAVARSTEPRARMRALIGAGYFAFLQSDYRRAEGLLDEAIDLARVHCERRSLAMALQARGSVARERGDYADSELRHQESLAVWEELGDERGAGRSLNCVALTAWLQGDCARAAEVGRKTHERFQRIGDAEGVVWALLNQAAAALHAGDPGVAARITGESLSIASEARFQEGVAWAQELLGSAALASGDREQAEAMFQSALGLHWSLGDRWRTASVVESLARVGAARDEWPRAVLLAGFAGRLREVVGAPLPPVERPHHQRLLSAARAALGDAAYAEMWQAGSRLEDEEAMLLAHRGQAEPLPA